MVNKEVLDFILAEKCEPIDSLSELFMMNEYYEQLTDEHHCSIAGCHLLLLKELQSGKCTKESIKFTETARLYYTHEENGIKVLSIRKDKLLPYEKYLISRIVCR